MLPTPPHWATSSPPGRMTAARLRNSASWSGTQWKVAVDRIASTAPSIGSGRPRSATTYSTRSPNRARRSRVASTIAAEPSSATTRAARQPLGQHFRHPTAAAARVEHAFVTGERQPFQHGRPPRVIGAATRS